MKGIAHISTLIVGALAIPADYQLAPRDSVTAVVNLASTRGASKHVASGFIYGIPDTPNQIPDHWYTDIAFNYGRAGGAQLDAPARGWVWGLTEYKNRFASTLSNYKTCRKYGASFVLLPHDVWGTDHTNSSTLWPGDNSDWTDYDNFVHQLMADIKANDMLPGLVWDVWNEPDISIFWERSQQQWIDLYIRTHKLLRADSSFNSVLISGPTLAYRPMSTNTWWTNWLSQIAADRTIPDQYAFHLEGALTAVDNDLQYTNASLTALLNTYGLPQRQININEYAASGEQVPAGAAWWISRLERYDAIGLRGNWLGGTTLHDLMANLLTKTANPYSYTATDYVAAPEYYVYKYYHQNMTGVRANTTGTTDRWMDVYSTIGSDKVRILCGVRVETGTWEITVNNLSAVGLPTSGTLNIQTWGFSGANVWAIVGGPSNEGIAAHAYSGNSVTFPIHQTDTHTAWAFEFAV
jgi:hypothetical protein